jgi:hypothetical protein
MKKITYLTKMIKEEAELIESFGQGKEFKHKGFSSLILNYGRAYSQVIDPTFKGEKRQCFANCTKGILRYSSLIYCEGYGMHHIFPHKVHHAWLINELGEVIDPTWGKESGQEHAYFGIAFHRQFVHKIIAKSKHYGLLTNEKLLRTFMKNGFPENSIITAEVE